METQPPPPPTPYPSPALLPHPKEVDFALNHVQQ